MKRHVITPVSLALFLGLASAQTQVTYGTLVGFAKNKVSSTPYGVLGLQKLCLKPVSCNTTLKYPGPTYCIPGATTWDKGLNAAWVSNGSWISVISPLFPKCREICKIRWWIRSYVTGMAVDSWNRILYLSDSTNSIYTFRILGPCRLKQISYCHINLPFGWHIQGLAFDAFHQDLFYVATKPSGTINRNVIYVARAKTPCKAFCKWEVRFPVMKLGPGTGLTYDCCMGRLVFTDGKWNVIINYKYPCSFKVFKVCSSYNLFWYGLGLYRSAVEPKFQLSGKKTRAWLPKTSNWYPDCPTVPGYRNGEPVMGNPYFTLTVSMGPSPKGMHHVAMVMFNWRGKCVPQQLWLPGSQYVIIYPFFDRFFDSYATIVRMGPGKCGISSAFRLPIPVDPVVCGYKFCGQWAVGSFSAFIPGRWGITCSRQFTVRIGG